MIIDNNLKKTQYLILQKQLIHPYLILTFFCFVFVTTPKTTKLELTKKY